MDEPADGRSKSRLLDVVLSIDSDRRDERNAPAGARGRRHVLLLLAGAVFGGLVTVGLQLVWRLACDSGAIDTARSCDSFEFALLPTLFGALFGAIAADLIWSRRH